MYKPFSIFALYLAFFFFFSIASVHSIHIAAWLHPWNQTTNKRARAVLPFLSSLWSTQKLPSLPILSSPARLAQSHSHWGVHVRHSVVAWFIVSFLQRPHCHASSHSFTSMRPIPPYVDTLLFYVLNWHHMRKLSRPLPLHVRTRALWPNRPHL